MLRKARALACDPQRRRGRRRRRGFIGVFAIKNGDLDLTRACLPFNVRGGTSGLHAELMNATLNPLLSGPLSDCRSYCDVFFCSTICPTYLRSLECLRAARRARLLVQCWQECATSRGVCFLAALAASQPLQREGEEAKDGGDLDSVASHPPT